ncbi:hypothetical protein PR202_gb14014 [Eleusine coracana subsp. coracana]|uniref:Ubiquitin carboxyl-terminal hydrolase n=1 Tax=Eleusine coracana subsp. coracana TaxID=191504 RepID=A0AAV5EU60_ELECO|nr:hypothetical protein PR202_gb14014 [Eleusine coracana subsp. coracana]
MALPSSASATAPGSAGERWPPLESSPDVFNQFMWSLGVPEDEAEFHDVYGLDEDALEMVPQPVVAVILCFPDPPQVHYTLMRQETFGFARFCRHLGINSWT